MSTIKKRDGFASVSIPFAKSVKNSERQQHTDDNGDNAEFSSIFHRYPPFFGKNLGKAIPHTLRYAGKQKVWLLQAK